MVKKIYKFIQLRRFEKILLLKAFILLGAIRLSLFFNPSGLMRDNLAKIHPNEKSNRGRQTTPESIAWAVAASSEYIPKATCLAQALATKLLLARYGYQSSLIIGVAKENAGDLKAHAWIEYGGKVIIGGPEVDLYARLPQFESKYVFGSWEEIDRNCSCESAAQDDTYENRIE